ncbi:NUDIX domain-containing protein [Candidatus Woesearchaeota archaeon]|nr:NUDIX domain-containing protein [Candidatus Woesearchaeota archaeon]
MEYCKCFGENSLRFLNILIFLKIMRRDVSVILLYDKEKRVLIQHRDDDAPTLPGYWAFFGGGIEEGESPVEALIRETYEELEYNIRNPKLMIVQKFGCKYINGEKHVYIEEYDENQKLVLNEGKDFKWVHIEDALELKMIKHDKEVLEYIKGKY